MNEHLPQCFLSDPCRNDDGHSIITTVAGIPLGRELCEACMADCICDRLQTSHRTAWITGCKAGRGYERTDMSHRIDELDKCYPQNNDWSNGWHEALKALRPAPHDTDHDDLAVLTIANLINKGLAEKQSLEEIARWIIEKWAADIPTAEWDEMSYEQGQREARKQDSVTMAAIIDKALVDPNTMTVGLEVVQELWDVVRTAT